MTNLPDLKAGIYEHYKGEYYLVLGYAHDANVEGERFVVVYVPLYFNLLSEGRSGPRMAVRDVDDFLFPHLHLGRLDSGPMAEECVETCEMAAGHRPRFRYVGPSA